MPFGVSVAGVTVAVLAAVAVALPLSRITVWIGNEPAVRNVWVAVTTNGVPAPPGWVTMPGAVSPSPKLTVAV